MGGGTFDQNHVMTSLDDCEMELFFLWRNLKNGDDHKKRRQSQKKDLSQKNGVNHKKVANTFLTIVVQLLLSSIILNLPRK